MQPCGTFHDFHGPNWFSRPYPVFEAICSFGLRPWFLEPFGSPGRKPCASRSTARTTVSAPRSTARTTVSVHAMVHCRVCSLAPHRSRRRAARAAHTQHGNNNSNSGKQNTVGEPYHPPLWRCHCRGRRRASKGDIATAGPLRANHRGTEDCRVSRGDPTDSDAPGNPTRKPCASRSTARTTVSAPKDNGTEEMHAMVHCRACSLAPHRSRRRAARAAHTTW